jgi:glycosyltransferase involved in cell wall biosynthesis
LISVVLPTRNPHLGRLQRTLAGLAAQTLPREEWEFVLVDNGSHPPLAAVSGTECRIVSESDPGLTPARLTGIRTARGEVLVFVDDDNVLDPTYLASVAARFAAMPALAAAGGPVVPEWETPPPWWTQEFQGLLALRDLGADPKLATGGPAAPWPEFGPVGAGLAIRRVAALAYADAVARDPRRRTLDRTAGRLSSGGDNDLVFTALHAGGDVAYFPELRLTHLIPASRLAPRYLARLNRGIMRTWVRVLALHGQCPWSAIPRWTVAARATRAWWRQHAWRGPAERVRWAGAVGQFEGLADIGTWQRTAGT